MSDILYQLSELKDKGMPFVVCIVVKTEGSTPRKEGAKMVVFADGSTIGTVGGGNIEMHSIKKALEVLQKGKPIKEAFQLEETLDMRCGGYAEIYFEPMNYSHNLYIFGAGHVGRDVGRFAAEFGFNVVFIDNRPDIYSDFSPNGAKTISAEFDNCVEEVELTSHDFAVICTPKHTWDEVVLCQLINKNLAYIGMIGSKRKVAETRKSILEKGIATEDQLNKINMPIGIAFNAETPAEIAISIVAKLIDAKNSLSK
jgi:xanthine dehydrogenase accessory factor